jgi:LysR family nitrogen assimilation transcriptional regulator
VEETRQEVKRSSNIGREVFVLGLTPSIMLLLGPDLLLDAVDALPGVFLSLVEELSFVLVEALERGELDAAFAYEVGERPGLSTHQVLIEELIYVTAPTQEDCDQTITFREALGRDLVLAGEKDSIRRLVHAAAEPLSLPVRVPFEAQSVSAMKAIVARRAAASILPFGSAAEELRRGVLRSRRITQPAIMRRLYLVRSNRRAASKNEDQVERFFRRVEQRLLASLGDLAKPAM